MILTRALSMVAATLSVAGLLGALACSAPTAPPAPTKAAAVAPAAPTKAAEAAKPAAQPTAAAAPRYPTKAVEIIIPFAPGGATDQINRFLAAYAQDKWKSPVTVTNKPGGSGFIGMAEAFRASPDGYTMLGHAVSAYLSLAATKNPPFSINDGTPIARLAVNPVCFTVKADSKWNSLKEVVEDVKKDPEKYTIASPGSAGLAVFTAAQLWIQAGIDPSKIRILVFEGGPQTQAAVAGGSADFTSQLVGDALSLYEAKKIRALAVTTPERVKQMPEVPTSKEAGFDQYKMQGYIGFGGPSKLPDHVAAAWDDLIKEAVKDPKFLAQLENAGFGPGYLGPKEYREFLNSEYKYASDIANRLGIMQ